MNSEVLVSREWTRDELAGCIRDSGGVPDDSTVDNLAGELRARLEDILEELVSVIDMAPATEPAASLYRLGVTLPSCNNCERYDKGICGHYGEKRKRQDWDSALDCWHYLSPHPWGTARRKLCYVDRGEGYYNYAEFPYEIVALEPCSNFPDALQVVNALRKDPEWSNRLDGLWKEVDEEESPGKWELAR